MSISSLIPDTVQTLPRADTGLLHGIVVSSPDEQARIRITLPVFDPEQEFGPIPFMPRAIGAPQPGDLCLVAFNEQGDPWVVAFEAPDAADRLERAILRLNDLAPPNGPVAMGGQKLTGLAAATAAGDGVRKSQLDAAAATAAAATAVAQSAAAAAAAAAADAAAAQATADSAVSDLGGKQDISEKGQPDGYASLDATGKVPASELPVIGTGGGVPVFVQDTDPALTDPYVWFEVDSGGDLVSIWVNA